MLKDTKTRNRLSKEVENLKLQIEIFALETNKQTDKQKRANSHSRYLPLLKVVIMERERERERERVGGGRKVQVFLACNRADLFGSWGKNVARKSDFSSHSFLIPLTSQPA